MPRQPKERSMKYRKKETSTRPYYSLRDISPLLFGEDIDPDGSEYKEIQRIVKTQQHLLGKTGTIRVPAHQIRGFLEVTKAFYWGGEARHLYEKMRNKKELSSTEREQLIELYKRSWKLNEESDEKESILAAVDINQEIIRAREEIFLLIGDDLESVGVLEHLGLELKMTKEYLRLMKQTFQDWRQELKILSRLEPIAAERGLDLARLDEDDDIEIIEELTVELTKEILSKMKI